MSAHPEHVGAPSISELDQAGYGRCAACHEIYEVADEEYCDPCIEGAARDMVEVLQVEVTRADAVDELDRRAQNERERQATLRSPPADPIHRGVEALVRGFRW